MEVPNVTMGLRKANLCSELFGIELKDAVQKFNLQSFDVEHKIIRMVNFKLVPATLHKQTFPSLN